MGGCLAGPVALAVGLGLLAIFAKEIWGKMIEPYYKSTGFIVDFANNEEEVSYCISEDAGDILIGKKIVEGGEVVVDEWLVTMNKETFEKLIEAYTSKRELEKT